MDRFGEAACVLQLLLNAFWKFSEVPVLPGEALATGLKPVVYQECQHSISLLHKNAFTEEDCLTFEERE